MQTNARLAPQGSQSLLLFELGNLVTIGGDNQADRSGLLKQMLGIKVAESSSLIRLSFSTSSCICGAPHNAVSQFMRRYQIPDLEVDPRTLRWSTYERLANSMDACCYPGSRAVDTFRVRAICQLKTCLPRRRVIRTSHFSIRHPTCVRFSAILDSALTTESSRIATMAQSHRSRRCL